jgi:hypothetical protein
VSQRAVLLPVLLLSLGLALTACGADSDEDQVTEAIETSINSTDPADCTELLTQSFVEQTEFEQGQAAVRACEESAPETANKPDSVEVSDVEVDGDAATASVAFEGGNFDGQTLAISLVSEDDEWKLDRIDSFVEFDQEALAAAVEETAVKGDDPATPEQAACVAENFRTGPPDQVQAALLSGDPEQLAPAFQGCGP